MKTDPTARFSNRVANYIKYRPGYPDEVISFLEEKCALNPGSKIADIGSGTGIFSALLLQNSHVVYGVEPNEAMRQSAEQRFKDNKNFLSVDGTAEATTLSDNSVDMVVCAQAFHWFKPDETRTEFKRILKSENNYVALIWNNRLTQVDEFAKAYEKLLEEKATDYSEVNHQHLKGVDFSYFYKGGQYTLTKFNNTQVFDYDGLAGRAFSSSYVPPQDTATGLEFAGLLKQIFDQYQVNGRVTIYYETEVYLGRV